MNFFLLLRSIQIRFINYDDLSYFNLFFFFFITIFITIVFIVKKYIIIWGISRILWKQCLENEFRKLKLSDLI